MENECYKGENFEDTIRPLINYLYLVPYIALLPDYDWPGIQMVDGNSELLLGRDIDFNETT